MLSEIQFSVSASTFLKEEKIGSEMIVMLIKMRGKKRVAKRWRGRVKRGKRG